MAIESWINHNKVEREEFSSILQENLKVEFFHLKLRKHFHIYLEYYHFTFVVCVHDGIDMSLM